MKLKKESKWFCENASLLEKYSGEWVAFFVNEGVVSHGRTLEKVLTDIKKARKVSGEPYIFHVPAKSDLTPPTPYFHVS